MASELVGRIRGEARERDIDGRCVGCDKEMETGVLCSPCEEKLRMLDEAFGDDGWTMETDP